MVCLAGTKGTKALGDIDPGYALDFPVRDANAIEIPNWWTLCADFRYASPKAVTEIVYLPGSAEVDLLVIEAKTSAAEAKSMVALATQAEITRNIFRRLRASHSSGVSSMRLELSLQPRV
jgi:hypothetical protein